MKNYILFLALSTSAITGMAQRAFKEATLREMSGEYKKDSKAFFINRLSEDFRYIDPEGKSLYKSDVTKAGIQMSMNTNDAQKILTALQAIDKMLENVLANAVSEPVVIQSSDLAVVTGKHKTTWVGSKGNEVTGDVAGSYAFQKRKGKWTFVSSQQTSLAE